MKERLNLNERIVVQMGLSALAKTYKENMDECQTNMELIPKASEFWVKSKKSWQDRYDEVMNLHTKIVEGGLLD
jgi:hypothetical protein